MVREKKILYVNYGGLCDHLVFSTLPEMCNKNGYDFYLSFREFEAKNLEHINEEERIIMPELQRLYTDEELRQGIDFKIYQSMTAEQMFHMLKVLFPQYNVDDKLAFLKDILDASQSEKFAVVWRQVFDELLTPDERHEIAGVLNL